jgi:hypothetical protein
LSRSAAPFALGTVATSTATFSGVSAGHDSSWSGGSITLAVPSGATTGAVVVTVGGMASGGVNFTVLSGPAILSVSPAAGTQVTISGSGFGTAQGTGAVLLGSTYGSVVSWSDSQVVATVATNARSGNAQVQRGGALSNAVAFTVITPTISTVTPTIGLPGTSVTIAGSGFGAIQGNGQVWLGTATGVVQTWGDSQIVALVGAGAASGNAQVLQNNVMSNAVPFTVNTPQIAGISPTSGVAGTSVTFSGTGFGANQGVVWLGSTAGQVVSWQDAQVVATVVSAAVSGIARIQRSDGLWSNALGFTVPAPGGNTVVPSLLNMVVGDTHTIQALSAGGQSVTGLTWTSSDPAAVSLSTDDPPVLTAVAAGHVTITAGTGSADVTVWAGALPVGTTIWSNPGNGSGVQYIVPAVPSASGVADVFAFPDDGTVQAITSDGTTAWTADISDAEWWEPDFQGGFVAAWYGNGLSISKWDGVTGQRHAVYTPDPSVDQLRFVTPYPDGTIFALQSGAAGDSVIGIDPTAGTLKFSVPVPGGTQEYEGWMIAGDGYFYLAYTFLGFGPNFTNHLRLLRVNSAGASDDIPISDWTSPEVGQWGWPMAMMTNADTGVLVTWGWGPQPPGMAVTTGTSVSLVNAPQVPNQASEVEPGLQAQDGSFVGGYLDEGGNYDMVAFDATGNVRWVVPNDTPAIATADGGVIGASGITYDAGGNATGSVGSLPTYSWKGAYQVGSVDSRVPFFDLALMATSYAAMGWGNLTGNGVSLVHHTFGLVFCGTNTNDDVHCSDTPDVTFSYFPGINDGNYGDAMDLSITYPQWARRIKEQAVESYRAALASVPAVVAGIGTVGNLDKASAPFEHTVYIDGHWMLPTEPPRSLLPPGAGSSYPPNGYTDPYNGWDQNAKQKSSRVYYLPVMGNAQIALGCADMTTACAAAVSPHYPPSPIDTVAMAQFEKLIPAIGHGIGTLAAHETAHQFVPRGQYLMDCDNPEFGCESNDVYESGAGDGGHGPWFYVDNARYYDFSQTIAGKIVNAHLHWGHKMLAAIANYLLRGDWSKSE